MILLALFVTVFKYTYADCPPPNIPVGVTIDNLGPYPNGAVVNGRCTGNGYFFGPSFMMCVFGNWAPPFLGQCSNGPEFSCSTPRAPEGARLDRQGPFGNGDSVEAICENGGHIIGIDRMTCLFGNWVPSFFGDCSTSRRYSCQVPSPKPGMVLSRQGLVPSDTSVSATCIEDMKVFVGPKRMTCIFGHWAPSQLGDCVDVSTLGKVVYSDGKGQVIIKYRNGTDIKDLGNGELLINYSSGGYGIEQVKGYRGIPDNEGHKWKIVDGMIYRDGTYMPIFGLNYGTMRLSGYEILPQHRESTDNSKGIYSVVQGVNILPGYTGVTVRNNVLYINGVPIARKTGTGSQGIFMNSVGSSFGGTTMVNNAFDTIIR